MKFVDNARFIANSLSNLVDSLPKVIHKIKWNYGHNKKYEEYGIRYRDCEFSLKYKNFRDDLLSFCCNRNYQKMFDKDLNKPFDNTYKFSFFFFKISISLFCCCKKVFTHTNAGIIEKNSMKHHYFERGFLQ